VYRSSLPLLYGSDESYQRSFEKFKTEMLRDEAELLFDNNTLQCNKFRHGEYMFCEAAKVDMNNALDVKGRNMNQNIILRTVDLVTVLFEDVLPGLHILNQMNNNGKKNMNPNHSFANTKYDFGQAEVYKESLDATELHALTIIESWCMFFHRDWNMNMLHIFHEVTKHIHYVNSIPHDIGYFLPNLSPTLAREYGPIYQQILTEKIEWAESPHAYFVVLDDKKEYHIIGKSLRPLQFPINKMPTMSSIYHTKGSGWDAVNQKQYFMSAKTGDNRNRQQKLMTTAKEYELAHLMLSTMESIRMIIPKQGYRKFEILCKTSDYQRANNTIRLRHPSFFRQDKYIFQPNDDLIMTLPFKWIQTLKNGEWTKLEKNWLTKINNNLNQASKNTVTSVRLVRCIGNSVHPDVWSSHQHNSKDVYSWEYVYKVHVRNQEMYVYDHQIGDIIGEEAWLGSEWFTLTNVGSGRLVSLSIGSKKKGSDDCSVAVKSDRDFSVGELVEVINHGSAWTHLATVLSLDVQNDEVKVKWESTRNIDTISFSDLKKLSPKPPSKRKRNQPDYYCNKGMGNKKAIEGQDKLVNVGDCTKNEFFSLENNSKLCAEGSIRILLSMLPYNSSEVSQFWELCLSPVTTILHQLLQTSVPNAVCNAQGIINPIEKCLWILRCKYNFATTSKMRPCFFTSVKKALNILQNMKFPVIVSVKGQLANYHHVVVIWRNRVLDYESSHVYPLTEDKLRQICGENTTYECITLAYGLFPPRDIRNKVTEINPEDWGISEYYHKRGKKYGKLFESRK